MSIRDHSESSQLHHSVDNAAPLIDSEGPKYLNGEQINYALELIEKRHQQRSTPFRTTWPFLKFMCCCFLKKKSFNLALKRAIRRKLNLAVPKSDERIEEDPFLLLGYGMNSYFQVMVELMWMVGIITLVLAPIMFTFSSFNALEVFPGYSWN
jgi:hypothetical protein